MKEKSCNGKKQKINIRFKKFPALGNYIYWKTLLKKKALKRECSKYSNLDCIATHKEKSLIHIHVETNSWVREYSLRSQTSLTRVGKFLPGIKFLSYLGTAIWISEILYLKLKGRLVYYLSCLDLWFPAWGPCTVHGAWQYFGESRARRVPFSWLYLRAFI